MLVVFSKKNSLSGHPIVNDHIYNTTAWGPSKGKGGDYGKSDEKVTVLHILKKVNLVQYIYARKINRGKLTR